MTLNTKQKTGIYVLCIIAALLLIVHNPTQGFVHDCRGIGDVIEERDCYADAFSHFSRWFSLGALHLGMAYVGTFLLAQALVVLLGVIWIALHRSDVDSVKAVK